MSDRPPVHFATTRRGRIAFQDIGSGPPTIVAIPPTAQNIEMAWDRPEITAMLDRFAAFSRYVMFDKRGTGSSDRTGIPGMEERVEDVRAVMDTAGVERAHFFAASEGGPMSILFAATYPERVESLVLVGTGATLVPPDLTEAEEEERREGHRRYAAIWGTADTPIIDGFAPSLAHDRDFRTWHERYERAAASADSLVDLLELTMEMDVREVLDRVDHPALVVHRTGDRIIPVEYGRALAAGLPNATMLELDGDDHFSYAGGLEWIDEVERFITGAVTTGPIRSIAQPDVRIQTLGRFAVRIDDEEMPQTEWGSRQARVLCQRLICARGWPIRRDELFDLLWPDEADRQKLSARLSVQLSAVRRVLGGGIIADRETVRLDLEHVTVDVEEFLRLHDERTIVESYVGEFLPAAVYDEFTGALRHDCAVHFVTAARSLGRELLAEGDPVGAASIGRRLIEVDRYDEQGHSLLVRSLLASGLGEQATAARSAWTEAASDLGSPHSVPALDDLA